MDPCTETVINRVRSRTAVEILAPASTREAAVEEVVAVEGALAGVGLTGTSTSAHATAGLGLASAVWRKEIEEGATGGALTAVVEVGADVAAGTRDRTSGVEAASTQVNRGGAETTDRMTSLNRTRTTAKEETSTATLSTTQTWSPTWRGQENSHICIHPAITILKYSIGIFINKIVFEDL